jgi:hypothetical protein
MWSARVKATSTILARAHSHAIKQRKSNGIWEQYVSGFHSYFGHTILMQWYRYRILLGVWGRDPSTGNVEDFVWGLRPGDPPTGNVERVGWDKFQTSPSNVTMLRAWSNISQNGWLPETLLDSIMRFNCVLPNSADLHFHFFPIDI